MVGELTGIAEFPVIDSEQTVEVSDDVQQLRDAAEAEDTAYVSGQVDESLNGSEEFTAAYAGGDFDLARHLYPRVRMHLERVEPIAEAFGDIDPAIGLREADSQESGGPWTGWRVLEKTYRCPPVPGRSVRSGAPRSPRR